jgi:hypothetical protein
MYAADVESGYKGDDLQKRLEENVRSGRLFFSRRASLEAPAGAGIFEERLKGVLAEKAATSFGRDLAAVVRRSSRSTAPMPAGATAEAV